MSETKQKKKYLPIPLTDKAHRKLIRLQSEFHKKTGGSISLKELANKNGVQLGSKNQYVLFSATIIHRLVEEGWSKADAFYAVCTDSTQLGNYWNSEKARHDFELTGSRKIAGKCDLANTYKILRNDEKGGGFWFASGDYKFYGFNNPLANLNLNFNYDIHYKNCVGWFVL